MLVPVRAILARVVTTRTAQPLSRIGYDGWISFRVPLARASAKVYSVSVRAVDIHGNRIDRSVSLRVKPKARPRR